MATFIENDPTPEEACPLAPSHSSYHRYCACQRRYSDTERPSTAPVGWQPTQVSPRTRPATAIGWEAKENMRGKKWRYCTESNEPSSVEGLHDSGQFDRSLDTSVFFDLLQSKRREKKKFQLLMELLIQNSSCVNVVGDDKMTLLHYAVLNGEELCVKALVAFGANVNAKNIFKQTPLDMAIDNLKEHLFSLLLSLGCLNGKDVPDASSASSSSFQRSPSTGVKKVKTTPIAMKSNFKPDLWSCSCSNDSDLSEQLDTHMDLILEASLSLDPDEAFALALQKREIARFRSRCSPSPPSCRHFPLAPPSPLVVKQRAQRILCLDGGGIRGLIQIDILCQIEKQTGKKITELFDWIIGTSTGGIVALALVYKQMPLYRLRNLYFRLTKEVFSKGRVGFCYDSERLEQLLKEELGTDMRMDSVSHPKILVCAVDKSNIPLKLNFFNNCFNDDFSQQLIWKVARYTTAAPMYFTECDNYVDGGVLANNPCIDGLAKIQSFYREKDQYFPVACMVSIGSGIYPSQELGSIDFQNFLRLKFSGMFRKAQSLITMLSSAIGESEALAERCKHNCEIQNISFFRFNPKLKEKIDPGVTDPLKLLEMIISARFYILNQTAELHQLFPLLQNH